MNLCPSEKTGLSTEVNYGKYAHTLETLSLLHTLVVSNLSSEFTPMCVLMSLYDINVNHLHSIVKDIDAFYFWQTVSEKCWQRCYLCQFKTWNFHHFMKMRQFFIIRCDNVVPHCSASLDMLDVPIF